MVSFNIIFLNITGYYQQISQITLRFSEYSIVRFFQSILNILLVCFLILNIKYEYIPKYEIYILGVSLINCINMGWYLVRYKDISFGTNGNIFIVAKDFLLFIKIGFPLLFANITSTLILTLDRQFVNIFFDNTTYAKYSFAFSMVSLVTVATSAIATVIYPTLKENHSKMLGIHFHLY
ncbi:oligosaccharide flippase family protein [Streptococcus didelphis]|nr:oligosaccharide flippase family protein [Streptococcus didelphis]WMB30118.1 oligosaccharide flippase family protein [Streptococcus didelphis]